MVRIWDSSYFYGNVIEDRVFIFFFKFDSGDIIEYSYEDKIVIVFNFILVWISIGDYVFVVFLIVSVRE